MTNTEEDEAVRFSFMLGPKQSQHMTTRNAVYVVTHHAFREPDIEETVAMRYFRWYPVPALPQLITVGGRE